MFRCNASHYWHSSHSFGVLRRVDALRSALAWSLAFVNKARPLPFPPIHQHANDRQKSKNYTQGISAGAKGGAKYKTKYRELKKKVKDIGTMSPSGKPKPT